MFLTKTHDFFTGYSEAQVEGFFVERFVNLCSIRGIEIWNIKKKAVGTIDFKIREKDLKRINEILKATRSELKIIKKVGIPNISKLYKKRICSISFIILSVLCIYISSLFVWKIEIVGNEKIVTKDIENILINNEIKVGMLKNHLDFEMFKKDLYVTRKDVAWVGVMLKGVKATIEIRERSIIDEKNEQSQNIIATRDGVIQKISVRSGQSLVKEGDLVCKGDVLVSGIFESQHSEPIRVNADADIVIKTWYTMKQAVPFQKTIISKSGKIDEKYSLNLGNYNINLGNNSTKFEKYDTINTVKKLVLLDRFELPISIDVSSYEELVVSDITYTDIQAEDIAKTEVTKKLSQTIPKEAEIINHIYNVYKDENEVIVRLTAECIENIGTIK